MITVLLPVYNGERTVARTIRSILSQSFTDFELIIADDGSTDRSAEVASAFRDHRIRLLRMPHRGLSATLNDGLACSNSEMVARIDVGDIAHPDRLQRQWDIHRSHPDAAVIASGYAVFHKERISYVIRPAQEGFLERRDLALHVPFAHSGVLYRRRSVLDEGGYAERPVEDYELWLRMMKRHRFYLSEDVLMFVEHAPDGLSTRDPARKYAEVHSIQAPYYEDITDSFGIPDSESALLRGWREFFYGEPGAARRHWGMRWSPKELMATVISLLPAGSLVKFKEMRMRFRMHYVLHYYSRMNIRIRSILASAIR